MEFLLKRIEDKFMHEFVYKLPIEHDYAYFSVKIVTTYKQKIAAVNRITNASITPRGSPITLQLYIAISVIKPQSTVGSGTTTLYETSRAVNCGKPLGNSHHTSFQDFLFQLRYLVTMQLGYT